MKNLLLLFVAIIFEVIATSSLKASEEFTKLWPSIITIVGYGLAFYFLSLTLRSIPMGIAYAMWSGIGIVLVSIIGVFVYNQKLDMPAVIGMALIVLGVVVINVFSKMGAH
ncbi:DMT family transporter [Myroides sp. LJL116]